MNVELRSRNDRGDGVVEPLPRILGDQLAIEELPHHQAHPTVHNELREDQQRHRHQKADVNLDVGEEWHRNGAAPELSRDGRQQQQREPGEQRDDDDATRGQFEGVARQVRASEELVQRAAEHQREVGLFQRQPLRRRERATLSVDVSSPHHHVAARVGRPVMDPGVRP